MKKYHYFDTGFLIFLAVIIISSCYGIASPPEPRHWCIPDSVESTCNRCGQIQMNYIYITDTSNERNKGDRRYH